SVARRIAEPEPTELDYVPTDDRSFVEAERRWG
ncbi:MAG: hypothetical protein JWR77_2234, partial [Rhizorhabdus sp.]|nr:hypothetical protein [Rhizorhabdus sp.]